MARKRRNFNAPFKAKAALDAIKGHRTISETACSPCGQLVIPSIMPASARIVSGRLSRPELKRCPNRQVRDL